MPVITGGITLGKEATVEDKEKLLVAIKESLNLRTLSDVDKKKIKGGKKWKK